LLGDRMSAPTPNRSPGIPWYLRHHTDEIGYRELITTETPRLEDAVKTCIQKIVIRLIR
jgi:hypothetical protein